MKIKILTIGIALVATSALAQTQPKTYQYFNDKNQYQGYSHEYKGNVDLFNSKGKYIGSYRQIGPDVEIFNAHGQYKGTVRSDSLKDEK